MVNKMIQMAIFVFGSQLLIYFRPREAYEKYFRLLVNLMIMLLFVVPMVGFLSNGTECGEEVWLKNLVEEINAKLDDVNMEGVLEKEDEILDEGKESLAGDEVRIVIDPIEIRNVEIGMEEDE